MAPILGRTARKLNKPHFQLRPDGKALIPLTRGMWATIDACDLLAVVKYSWCAMVRRHTTYAQANIKINGKWRRVFMHRLLLASPDNCLVDHKDGNGLNNARENLRLATNSQNLHNAGPSRKASKTCRFKGVSWSKAQKQWNVQLAVMGANRNFGYYDSEEEAAKAFDAVATLLVGDFARTNGLLAPTPEAPPPGPPLRVAVVGPCDKSNYLLVDAAMRESGFAPSEVVVGAAEGIARMANVWASIRGIPVKQIRAEWKKHSRHAAAIRRQRIVEEAEAIVALWDGVNQDIEATVIRAREKGAAIYVRMLA